MHGGSGNDRVRGGAAESGAMSRQFKHARLQHGDQQHQPLLEGTFASPVRTGGSGSRYKSGHFGGNSDCPAHGHAGNGHSTGHAEPAVGKLKHLSIEYVQRVDDLQYHQFVVVDNVEHIEHIDDIQLIKRINDRKR